MSSTDVLTWTGPEPRLARPRVRELLVLWQHPESLALLVIGRFGYDGETYTFSYARQAAQIPGLRPLPGLRDLTGSYRGSHMPPVFEQRVMSRRRPDYARYLERIGLAPTNGTPWEQIVHSGGARVGDALQFMELPQVHDGYAHARFFANGIRHITDSARNVGGHAVTVTRDDQEAALGHLCPGDRILLEPESGNPVDGNACVIMAGETPIGWVPMAISAHVRRLMGAPQGLPATVARIAPPGSPAHTRLVVDLDVPAPRGFTFDPEGLWEPLGR